MDMIASKICWLIFGYLLGSCPTGFILVKMLTGEDIRQLGSGNIGATNVGRVLGRGWAIFTALFDMLKGGIAIVIAIIAGVDSPTVLALIGAMAVVGHNYPLWLKFKGGKGVATTFGVFAFYSFFDPLPALIGGAVWLIIREMTLCVSASSMTALAVSALTMPLFMFERPYYVTAIALAILSAWRHRENIKRLLAGTENKVIPIFPVISKLFARITKH